MKRSEGLAYLTQCADETDTHWSGGVRWSAEDCPICGGTNDTGHLRVPCSRYGRNAEECAPVAWRVAYLVAREQGIDVDRDLLEHAMSLVVNDSDEPAYMIRAYGRSWVTGEQYCERDW